jgi:hypothetical protein
MRIPRAVLFPFTHWNWKAALLSAVFRAGACVAALRHNEMHARRHFGIVEAAYVLLTSGFWAALQQQSLGLKTRRLGWLACVMLIPLSSLTADASLHLWLDHGNMRALGISALIFTLVSAMFHWHVMQNGAMVVGEQSRSFWSDMKRMPWLVASFVMIPVRWIRTAEESPAGTEEREAELVA